MENKNIIELVKKIRNETGLGLMEIKAALEEASGDEKKAKEILKEQGLVATYTHSTGKIGAMIELLCETDFVAKNEDFIKVAKELCLQVAAMDPKDTKELLEQEYIKDPSQKMKDLVVALNSKFGENIKVGRIQRFEI